MFEQTWQSRVQGPRTLAGHDLVLNCGLKAVLQIVLGVGPHRCAVGGNMAGNITPGRPGLRPSPQGGNIPSRGTVVAVPMSLSGQAHAVVRCPPEAGTRRVSET